MVLYLSFYWHNTCNPEEDPVGLPSLLLPGGRSWESFHDYKYHPCLHQNMPGQAHLTVAHSSCHQVRGGKVDLEQSRADAKKLLWLPIRWRAALADFVLPSLCSPHKTGIGK